MIPVFDSQKGVLGFFKYFNFFAESFADAFTFLGKSIDPFRLRIILPVGISFYTFQTLSYTIDVYRGRQPAERHFGIFAVYVAFFPQLVAGPIVRASQLLPQLQRKITLKQEQVTHHIVSEGEVVFLDHTETWTFKTGEVAAHTFATMHEIRDGLVYRWSDYWDMQKFVGQFPGWFLEEMMKSTAAAVTTSS